MILLVSMNIAVVWRGTPSHHHSADKHYSSTSSSTAHHQLIRRNKKGQIVHHAITNVSLQDLADLKDETFLQEKDTTTNNITYEEAIQGRQELVALLQDAGVTNIDVPTLLLLPTWETVKKLYGDAPVVYGLDQCSYYQQTIPKNDASLGVAGIFNTGTNLLAMYLSANCRMPENPQRNHGMRWQVPWGKHMLASMKWTNTAKRDEKQNKTNVLPVVLLRDPYSWMNSMCKHPYAAKWHHSDHHCPNLVPNMHDYAIYPFPGKNIPVRINFTGNKTGQVHKWNSLAHVWSDWYGQYKDADYPRLMIRFEDLVFHPRQLIRTICECGGAEPFDQQNPDSFIYMVDSAKWGPGHGGDNAKKTSLISAMIKYGSEARRLQGFTKDDLELAHVALDPELMSIFHYNVPLNDAKRESR